MINFSEERRGCSRKIGYCVLAATILCIGVLVVARFSPQVRMWRVSYILGIEPSWRALDAYLADVFTVGNKKEYIFDAISKIKPQSVVEEPIPDALSGQNVYCYRLSFQPALGNRWMDRVLCFDIEGQLVSVDLVTQADL